MDCSKCTEEWRPVVGLEGLYEVSSCGRVRSLNRVLVDSKRRRQRPRGRVLKSWLVHGYPDVALWKNGVRIQRHIHVLVCAAFIGPRPNRHDCAHNDGVRTNNHPWNLRYDTRAGNRADMIAHGTLLCGGRNHAAKLTAEDVAAIRSAVNAGESQRSVARRFGVSHVTIGNIARGRAWTSVVS